jgi:prevent-host-death family protein
MSSSTDISRLPSVSATDIKNAFASVWDRMLAEGAIAITKHEKPKAVLVSIERFEELIRSNRSALDQLTEEFDDLLTGMQSAKAKRGMAEAFKANPAQLGRTAVSAARKQKK